MVFDRDAVFIDLESLDARSVADLLRAKRDGSPPELVVTDVLTLFPCRLVSVVSFENLANPIGKRELDVIDRRDLRVVARVDRDF